MLFSRSSIIRKLTLNYPHNKVKLIKLSSKMLFELRIINKLSYSRGIPASFVLFMALVYVMK